MLCYSRRALVAFCRKRSGAACLSSTGNTKVLTSEIDANGVAELTLNNKPVNALSSATLSELIHEVESLERNPRCRGVVLTSKLPKIFSAGIDLPECIDDFPEGFKSYWSLFRAAFIALYKTRLATVAAINGHSPAGGCVMAMACDYRIMAEGDYTIGLSGPKIGVSVPFWVCDRYRHLIGHRMAERHIQLGSLFSPQQALDVGIIDELCQEKYLSQNAKSQLSKMLQIDDDTRTAIKDYHRRDLYIAMQDRRQEDITFMVEKMGHDSCQKSLRAALQKLKQRKAK